MSGGGSSPLGVIYVLLLSLEASASIFINMFITSVIVRDYRLKKKLTTMQKIQASLNVSSAFFTIVSSFNVFFHLLLPEVSTALYFNIVFILLFIYSMCSSSFLTALLCFYSFIKVVNVRRGFLSWVKKKIDSIVPWLIVLTKFCSLLNSLLSLLLYIPNHLLPTNGSFVLSTSGTVDLVSVNYSMIKLLLMMICIPLLCTAITILLTVGFLKLHSHRMKNSQTSGEASLTLYKRVIYRMLRFLVLYSAFYLVLFLYYFKIFCPQSPGYYINLMLMFLFTPAQSALHILDNQYLRSSWKEMAGCIMRSTHHKA